MRSEVIRANVDLSMRGHLVKVSWSGVLLVALAMSASGQRPRAVAIPFVDRPAWSLPAKSALQKTPSIGLMRIHADTTLKRSRRRQITGAVIGAVVGGLAGGTYAFLEDQTGCKVMVGLDPCDKPHHLWAYPIGGAAIGALAGALIARF